MGIIFHFEWKMQWRDFRLGKFYEIQVAASKVDGCNGK